MKNALFYLKSSFSHDLKSNLVYTWSCCGCYCTYVGQIVRNLATKIEEHKKKDSPIGNHIRQCAKEATTAQLNWEMIDQSNNAVKLLSLKALLIRKMWPGINTRDEFRSRELTLRF